MNGAHHDYATHLAAALLRRHAPLSAHGADAQKICAAKSNGEVATLDLTPFQSAVHRPDARAFFQNVTTITDLIVAYHKARGAKHFEDDQPEARASVHPYARKFLDELLACAERTTTDAQARLIARWVSDLDIYVAVKAVESLLNSKADIALLEVAARKNWIVHFDHLAIRCGHAGRRDAERVVRLLRSEHGYTTSQVRGEDFYQFSDGWNAYPLYKMLDNGQALRLFIDQSDANHATQIIQHWNRVYGFTAHHLGLRATEITNGARRAIPLAEMIDALNENGIAALTPTGDYTQGLLLQVFTKPERAPDVPPAIKQELRAIHADLERSIENAKLLELVSREEVPPELAREYFALYGLSYDAQAPLHSVPAYQYFLPAQAAHVIKTSIQAR